MAHAFDEDLIYQAGKFLKSSWVLGKITADNTRPLVLLNHRHKLVSQWR